MSTEETKDTSKNYLTNFKTLEEKIAEYLVRDKKAGFITHRSEVAKHITKIVHEHYSRWSDD